MTTDDTKPAAPSEAPNVAPVPPAERGERLITLTGRIVLYARVEADPVERPTVKSIETLIETGLALNGFVATVELNDSDR